MPSSQDSDLSLPSPDRVANLWRFDQTPAKSKAVSKEEDEGGVSNSAGGSAADVHHHPSGVTVPPRHGLGSPACAEVLVDCDGNLEEWDVPMGRWSKSNTCGGEREFSNIVQEYENQSQSRSLDEAGYISAGDISGGQVEQEQHGVLLLSSRWLESSQSGSRQEGQVGDTGQDPHGSLEYKETEQETVPGEVLEKVEQKEQQCVQEQKKVEEPTWTPSRELGIIEAGGNGQVQTPKTDQRTGLVKRTASEANFEIDLDNMESDYDLVSGKTPGEQHFGGTPSSHVDAAGNLDEMVPFDETVSDPQMQSRILNNISPLSSLCGAPGVDDSGRHASSNIVGNQGRPQIGGPVSGTKSASTAWSLPMRGREAAGNNYTPSTPLNRNYTSSTPQSRNYTSSTPQANFVPSSPSRREGYNFSTSTPIRRGSGTPEAPQWSPHPSPGLCGAREGSLQVQSTAEVSRQNSSPGSLGGNMPQMPSSVQGGFVTPSRPRYQNMANKSHSVQVTEAKL